MCFKKKNNDGRDIPQVCEFCEFAIIINDEENVLCSKRGIVGRGGKCRKFIYDPLKREPKVLPPIPKLSEEDML